MQIQPNNWTDFQHYKERAPVWIKLHRKMIDNYEFHCLPVASRALAPMLWLLASEYQDGIIDASEEKIAFRLRLAPSELVAALFPLISSGFFISYGDDSELLADRYHDAIPRALARDRDREEKEKSSVHLDDAPCANQKNLDFLLFWDAFDYKKGKGGAESSWKKIKGYSPELVKTIISAAIKEAASRPVIIAQGRTPKMAQGWLTEKRWEDDHTETMIIQPQAVQPVDHRRML